MKRQLLLGMLYNYHPKDEAEQKFKEDMILFIKEHEDCFERTLAVGHITASAWLLNKDKSEFLLMHHAKLDKWVQLGGHCDGDFDPLRVALKEAEEESGLKNIVPVSEDIFDIDIHLIPANSKEKEHYHYDVRFLFQVQGSEALVQNSESKALSWFGREKTALPTQERSVVRMFDKFTGLNI